MIKRKFVLGFSALMVAGVVAYGANSVSKGRAFIGTDNVFALSFDATHNLATESATVVSGDFNATTEAENTVAFAFEGAKKESGSWLTLDDGEIHNVGALNGVSSIALNLVSGAVDVMYGTLKGGAVYYSATESVSAAGLTNLPISGDVTHVKLAAENAVINSLKFEYSCTGGVVTDEETPSLVGNGTEAHPFCVSDLDTWNAMATVAEGSSLDGKEIILTQDVGTVVRGKKIGNGTYPFGGHFNGQGFKIDVDLSYPTGDANQGLFGKTKAGALIENLTTTGKVVAANTGVSRIAPIVGWLNGGTVKNCTNEATVTGAGKAFAGIVGGTALTSSIIGCVNKGKITGTATYTGNNGQGFGGVLGIAESTAVLTVEDCDNHGEIDGKCTCVGGVIGAIYKNASNAGIVKNCTNDAFVHTSASVNSTTNDGLAGIAGYAMNVKMSNCENSGKIEGLKCSEVAGICGKFMEGSVMTDCVNSGDVYGIDQVGAFVGRFSGTLTNNSNSATIYWVTGTMHGQDVGTNRGGTINNGSMTGSVTQYVAA